jgi:hypothetical protein
MFETMFRSGVPPHIGQSPVPGSDANIGVDELVDTMPAASSTAAADRKKIREVIGGLRLVIGDGIGCWSLAMGR